MQSPPLNQPLNLQFDTRIHRVLKVFVGVFKGQGVGEGEILRNLEEKFGREGHELHPSRALGFCRTHCFLLRFILCAHCKV